MTNFLSWIKKALLAGAAAGGAAFYAAYPDGVTPDEWAKIIGAIIVTGLGVFLIPNRPTPN